MATTQESPPTQPIAAGLMAISGAWIAWAADRRPASPPVFAQLV